jgi:hypothetical protein
MSIPGSPKGVSDPAQANSAAGSVPESELGPNGGVVSGSGITASAPRVVGWELPCKFGRSYVRIGAS